MTNGSTFMPNNNNNIIIIIIPPITISSYVLQQRFVSVRSSWFGWNCACTLNDTWQLFNVLSLSVPEILSRLDSWRTFLDLNARKWRRQFVFFWRCHWCASGATVVVLSETANICFLSTIFVISFGYCKRECRRSSSSALSKSSRKLSLLWPVNLAICERKMFAFLS